MPTQLFPTLNTYTVRNLELTLKVFLSPAFLLNFFSTDFILLFNPICLFLPNKSKDLRFFLWLLVLGLEPQFSGLSSSGSAPGSSLQAVLVCTWESVAAAESLGLVKLLFWWGRRIFYWGIRLSSICFKLLLFKFCLFVPSFFPSRKLSLCCLTFVINEN